MADDVQSQKLSRRSLVTGVAGAVVGAVATRAAIAQPPNSQPPGAPAPNAPAGTPPPAAPPTVPADPSVVPGIPGGPLGERSPFEHPALAPTGVTTGAALTPLQALSGTITPSDLVFQRHHNGIALIDPATYTLTIHGLVDRATTFTLAELKRFPSVTRTHFIECAGNGRAAYRAPKPEMTPQDVDGMTSNCEWTGVPLATLLREVGFSRRARWVLAEGGDADKLARSIPIEKATDDAIVVWAQNGEPLRAGNGYPVRLLLPGYEGNMQIKWLRRLELGMEPWMTRDETSKYTDPLPNGTARRFSFAMDAKSIITSPAHPSRLTGAGWWPVTGLAWSGRGTIVRVDVSTDGGDHWTEAELVGPALPQAHTRFQHMWRWNGRPARLMSRAIDETGYVQPTLAEFARVRGRGTDYHFNAIRAWDVQADGQVHFGVMS
jgi:sulfane dehydrogenase subunit SoxC